MSSVNPHGPLIRKSDGSSEPFDPRKLLASLVQARATPEVAEEIVQSIARTVKGEQTTEQIYRTAWKLLAKRLRPAASRYGLRRSILELGPTGFPFERFLAQLYQADGYETQVDATLYGACVSHEIDVVAWRKAETISVEAKFHNDLSFKTDTKVILYVKARVEDLQTHAHAIGGKQREISRGVVATNTKFTETAIDYAGCVGIELLSWETPRGDNLYDRMGRHGIFPITCLTTLATRDKKKLIEANMVDTRSAREYRDEFAAILGDKSKAAAAQEEIQEITKLFASED